MGCLGDRLKTENDDSSKAYVKLERVIIEFRGHIQAAAGCSVAVSG